MDTPFVKGLLSATHQGCSLSKSGVGQHSVERFIHGQRVHPSTRAKLKEAVETLEQLEAAIHEA